MDGEALKVPLDGTNWGKPEHGVRLLIYTTNAILQAGLSINALTIITNGSSARILLDEMGPDDDFDLFLTNSAGRYYHLTPPRAHMNTAAAIEAGTESAMMIPVRFRANIQPGDYLLIATRYFTLNRADFRLEIQPSEDSDQIVSQSPDVFYGDWASGKSFAISAWAAQPLGNDDAGPEVYFQAVGDPFVRT